MNTFKRIFCLILALVLMLSMFGCGKDETRPTDPQQNVNPSGNATDPSGSNGEEAIYDFGGATIRIASWVEAAPVLGNSEEEDARYNSLQAAMEKYNCKVEWIVNSQDAHFSTFVQKSLSGESYCDILMCHSWNYVSLINQGLLVPTTDFINNAEDAYHWNTTTYMFRGENWGIAPQWELYWPSYTFLVNTKILRELGLENPQELVRRGEWTWEKFREYCKLATDPSKEQYGVSCFMLPHVLNSCNNFDYAVPDENGVYHNGFTYEKTKQAGMELLELIEKMSQEDKSIKGDWCDGVEAMNDASLSFKNGQLLFAFVSNVADIKASGFEDYSVVTIPEGPSSTGLKDTVQAFSFWSLPTESEFPPEALAAFWMEYQRVWDESEPDQYYVLDEEGIESIAQYYRFLWYQDIDDVYFLVEVCKDMKMEAAANVSWGSLIANDLFGAIIRGETTPAAVVQQLDGEIQSLIDATYNN